MKPPRRAIVKMDKYAPFQLKQELGLRPAEQHLLMVLALQAGRSGTFSGSLRRLRDDMGTAPKTNRTALDGLQRAGCVKILHPFTQNGEGVVEIIGFDRLVATSSSYGAGPADDEVTSNGPHQNQYTEGTHSAPIRDQVRRIDAIDQGKTRSPRNKALREKGCSGSDSDEVQRCLCGQPVAGHPFDHEPVPGADDEPSSPPNWHREQHPYARGAELPLVEGAALDLDQLDELYKDEPEDQLDHELREMFEQSDLAYLDEVPP